MATEQVVGLHAVEAALRHEPERVAGLWVDAGRRDARLATLVAGAGERGIAVHAVARAELDRMSGGARHQGAVARLTGVAAALGENDLEAILDALAVPPLLLVLDGVKDPHNLGACLRTAEAAGAHALIAPADRAAGLTPTVRRVASGAAETLPFVQVTNLARTLRRLKERGLWVVGAAGEGTARLHEVDLAGPVALVLGAEERGLRRLTREVCDVLAAIPMAGSVSSLNVSVAAGVFLFEAVRQRAVSGA